MAHRGAVVERRKFAQPYAVAEAIALAPGDLEREPGLADAAYPGQRQQWPLMERGGDMRQLLRGAR